MERIQIIEKVAEKYGVKKNSLINFTEKQLMTLLNEKEDEKSDTKIVKKVKNNISKKEVNNINFNLFKLI